MQDSFNFVMEIPRRTTTHAYFFQEMKWMMTEQKPLNFTRFHISRRDQIIVSFALWSIFIKAQKKT